MYRIKHITATPYCGACWSSYLKTWMPWESDKVTRYTEDEKAIATLPKDGEWFKE